MAALLFEVQTLSSNRDLKGSRKLRSIMIIFVSVVSLISEDASGLRCTVHVV